MMMLVLAAALSASPASEAPKPATPAATNPRVELETNKGKIVLELDAAKAPKSVANFLEYVKSGHYDGTIFHRVMAGFMVQGGGFDTRMEQKATRPPIQNEADNGLKNARGTVAMARTSDPHSASSQFFVNLVDNAFLNYKSKDAQGWGYTVFGKVVEGMDVVDAIAKIKTGPRGPFGSDVPSEGVQIIKATVL